MANLKILGILMRYITARIFSVTYRFCNHTRHKNFYSPINEADASLTLGKALEKIEK